MPDVGVLELQIQDNSKGAGTGLKNLAGALNAVREAVGSGLDLSPVAASIKQLHDTIASQKGASTTIKNLGTLFNSITKLKKVEKIKFDTSSLENLKRAVGTGWNIGDVGTQLNKINEAMSGATGGDLFIANMKGIREQANAMAKANTSGKLMQVADAIQKYTASLKSGEVLPNDFKAGSVMKLNLQQFGGKGKKQVPGQTQMDLDSLMKPAVEGLEQVESKTQQVTQTLGSFTEKVNETKQAVNDTFQGFSMSVADPITALMDRFRNPDAVPSDVFDFAIKKINELGVQAQINTKYIEKLMSYLNKPGGGIKGWKFADTVNASVGIGMESHGEENIEMLTKNLDELERRAEMVEKIRDLMWQLEKPIDYSNLSYQVEQAAGISPFGRYAEAKWSEEDVGNLLQNADQIQDNIEAYHLLQQAVNEVAESSKPVNAEGMQVFSSIEEAAKAMGISVEEAKKKTDDLMSMLNSNITVANVFSSLEEAAKATGKSVEQLKTEMDELLVKIGVISGDTSGVGGTGDATGGMVSTLLPESSTSGAESTASKIDKLIDDMVKSTSKVDIINMKIQSLRDTLAISLVNGTSSKEIAGTIEQIQKLQDALAEAEKNASFFGKLKSSVKDLLPNVTGLVKRFSSMAKMRMLRYVIRSIAQGFSEGVKNVYEYSKAMGTSFAPAMDSASQILAQFKNSVGAAAAPALQALIPILQQIANAAITVFNILNQVFSLLTGQATWTRALLDTSKGFGEVKKTAGGAGSAIKDLLADWDELNIIQSQSGGGGGGGAGDVTGIENMFETVDKYSSWIKQFVQGIKDTFGDVMNLVKEIGILLLGWKFATALTGPLAILGSIVGGVATIDLVFKLTNMFARNFLQTGEDGWLIGDVLTTLVGSFLMKQILKPVLDGNAGNVGIPLIFAVSAMADIFANIQETNVDALSRESLMVSLLAALKGSVVGAYLGKMGFFGGSVSPLAGAGITALATFGIALLLKAEAKVATDGITPENVKAAVAGGLAVTAAGAWFGLKTAGTAAGAAAGGLIFGGAAVASFGVAVGLNAINETVSARSITPNVIKENFLAGGLVGLGLAIGTIALASGATVLGIIGIGAAGAAVTIAALFAIEAVIAAQPVKVEWGNYDATKEEIESYVNTRLFNDPPEATIATIRAKLDTKATVMGDLTDDVSSLFGTMYALKVGLKPNTYDEVKSQIEKFVADFNSATSYYQDALQVGLTITVPTINIESEEGKGNSTTEIIKRSDERWTKLNDEMKKLGKELADAYSIAYDDTLDANVRKDAEDTIEKITNMMTEVADAIATGQAKAKTANALKQNMMNLSKDTVGQILEEYKAQRDALVEELVKLRQESAEGVLAQQYAYEKLAEYALKDANFDEANEEYLKWKALAEEAKADYLALVQTTPEDVRKEAENALLNENERKDLAADLINMLVLKPEDISASMEETKKFFESVYGNGALAGVKESLFKALMSSDKETRDNAMGEVFFESFLRELVGDENYDIFKGYIDEGLLKYGELFNKDFIDNITDILDIEHQDSKVQTAWKNYIKEMFGMDIELEDFKPGKGIFEKAQESLLGGFPDEMEKVKKELESVKTSSFLTEGIDKITVAFENAKKACENFYNSLDGLNMSSNAISMFKEMYDAAIEFGGTPDFDFQHNRIMNKYGSETYDEVAFYIDKLLKDVEQMSEGGYIDTNTLQEKYGKFFGAPQGKVQVDNDDISSGVQKGMEPTTNTLSAGIDRTNSLLERLLLKEFVAQIKQSPSNGLGLGGLVGLGSIINGGA